MVDFRIEAVRNLIKNSKLRIVQFELHFERGERTFEVRRDDQCFQKGDRLLLNRYVKDQDGVYVPDADSAGRIRKSLGCKVLHVLRGGQFGIKKEYVVLSIRVIPEAKRKKPEDK